MVGGNYVDPKEWWDPHWLKDNVQRLYQDAGLKPPLDTPPPPPSASDQAQAEKKSAAGQKQR
jgi:hypothetical protein